MLKTIRRGVFETNSSSVHTLTICTKEQFDKWCEGELLYDRWDGKFKNLPEMSKEDKLAAEAEYKKNQNEFTRSWEELSERSKNNYYKQYESKHLNLYREDLLTRDEYDYLGFEQYQEFFTTPSGDEMVAFGHYGYDG